MTIRVADNGVIVLEGACSIEDAEPLLQHLLAAPHPTIDWRDCEAAHLAVVQILITARPTLLGPPRGTFLAEWVEPLISGRA